MPDAWRHRRRLEVQAGSTATAWGAESRPHRGRRGAMGAPGGVSDGDGFWRPARPPRVPIPGVEIGIAVSGLVIGLMVLFELRPPLCLAALIVSVFAVFHGHAHGLELPAGSNALPYSLVFVIATGLLHVVGILLGETRRWPGGRRFVHAAGGCVALGGCGFWSRPCDEHAADPSNAHRSGPLVKRDGPAGPGTHRPAAGDRPGAAGCAGLPSLQGTPTCAAAPGLAAGCPGGAAAACGVAACGCGAQRAVCPGGGISTRLPFMSPGRSAGRDRRHRCGEHPSVPIVGATHPRWRPPWRCC